MWAKFSVSSTRNLWLNRGMKQLASLILAGLMLLGGVTTAGAQKNPFATNGKPMRRPPPDPHAPRWHTIRVLPDSDLPHIHFYDKLNPVWWFGNLNTPVPPASYRPEDPRREMKWYFRNPLHNFTFYVVGVADKPFYRSGYYPERNFDPTGGWNFAVSRRHILLLPYVSYQRQWCTFYLGWRERGNFGIKLNIPGKRVPRPAPAWPEPVPSLQMK
jgi:hypothetical protein